MKPEVLIRKFGEEHNILTGICGCEPFDYMETVLSEKKIPFTEPDIKKRIDPSLTMPGCKSIVTVGVGYNKKLSRELDFSECRGNLSMLGAGTDYHKLVTDKLNKLADYILKFEKFDYRIFCDTGPLVDREVAKRAGLGFAGKNRAIISDKFGPLFSIGYMLTSMELEPSSGIKTKACGSCNICINACPTGALSANGFEYERCVSYLTQSKDEIPEFLAEKMGLQLYGCDICGTVCPYSDGTPFQSIENIEDINPRLDEFSALSNTGFKEKYSDRAFFWRGKKILQRNACIAKENWKQNGILEYQGTPRERV